MNETEGTCPTCGRKLIEDKDAGVKEHTGPTEEERKRELHRQLLETMTTPATHRPVFGDVRRRLF